MFMRDEEGKVTLNPLGNCQLAPKRGFSVAAKSYQGSVLPTRANGD